MMHSVSSMLTFLFSCRESPWRPFAFRHQAHGNEPRHPLHVEVNVLAGPAGSTIYFSFIIFLYGSQGWRILILADTAGSLDPLQRPL